MIVYPAWPIAGHTIDTDAPLAREKVAEHYRLPARERSLRVNLVTTIDGGVQGPDGTSASLSGGADRVVLGAIRSLSDVVLVGASTFRAEPGLLPRRTPLAVVTRTGELGDVTPPSGRPHGPVYVFAPQSARARVAATLHAPFTFVPVQAELALNAFLPSVLTQLGALGMHHVVCEGGASLVRALVDLQLVDELCLTVAPQFATSAAARIFDGRLERPQTAPLTGVLTDDAGFLYTRRRLV